MDDEILKGTGLKFEDLSPFEKETYFKRLKKLKDEPFTVEDIKENVRKMREEVEMELVDTPEYVHVFIFKVINRKHLELKARLKNYLLLEMYITGRQKMKKRIAEELE